MSSSQPVKWFSRALDELLSTERPRTATGQEWLGILNSLQQKGRVKKEELTTLGVPDLLGGENASRRFNRDQFEVLRDRLPEVNTYTLDREPLNSGQQRELLQLESRLNPARPFNPQTARAPLSEREMQRYHDLMAQSSRAKKWGGYESLRTPGAENYRENILWSPQALKDWESLDPNHFSEIRSYDPLTMGRGEEGLRQIAWNRMQDWEHPDVGALQYLDEIQSLRHDPTPDKFYHNMEYNGPILPTGEPLYRWAGNESDADGNRVNRQQELFEALGDWSDLSPYSQYIMKGTHEGPLVTTSGDNGLPFGGVGYAPFQKEWAPLVFRQALWEAANSAVDKGRPVNLGAISGMGQRARYGPTLSQRRLNVYDSTIPDIMRKEASRLQNDPKTAFRTIESGVPRPMFDPFAEGAVPPFEPENFQGPLRPNFPSHYTAPLNLLTLAPKTGEDILKKGLPLWKKGGSIKANQISQEMRNLRTGIRPR